MKTSLLFIGILALAVFLSALTVMFTSHESRKRFVELQALQEARDELNVEWGRLQLEQSTWATYARVDAIARNQLNMFIPPPQAVVIVNP